jgi:hypothetical protein
VRPVTSVAKSGRFIADFLARSAWLVVEVDGAYHVTRRTADARRDWKLPRMGYRVLRLDAELVRRDVHAALQHIRARADRGVLNPASSCSTFGSARSPLVLGPRLVKFAFRGTSRILEPVSALTKNDSTRDHKGLPRCCAYSFDRTDRIGSGALSPTHLAADMPADGPPQYRQSFPPWQPKLAHRTRSRALAAVARRARAAITDRAA